MSANLMLNCARGKSDTTWATHASWHVEMNQIVESLPFDELAKIIDIKDKDSSALSRNV